MNVRVILFSAASFLVGVIAVVAVIVFNPLVKSTTHATPITSVDAASHVVEVFTINAPADLVAITHNGTNIIEPMPSGIELLREPGIQSGLLLVAKVRDAKGQIVGFAVETETMDAASNPLLGKMRMHTDWTIVLPARGTIYVSQIEDAGVIGKGILPAVMLGGEWNGKADFVSTAGPDASGRGIIVGGTREFWGISGSFVELSHLTHMSQKRGGVGSFELQFSYKVPEYR